MELQEVASAVPRRLSQAETAELRRGGSGGEAKGSQESFGRLRPAGGRAHCLRFAHPAEADWRLEAKVPFAVCLKQGSSSLEADAGLLLFDVLTSCLVIHCVGVY